LPPNEVTRLDLTDLVSGRDPSLLPLVLSIQNALFLVAGIVLMRWRVGRARAGAHSGPLATVLLGLAAGVAALVLGSATAIGLDALGLPVEEQDWLRQILERPDVLARLAPWLVLIGPIAEEVFFRGYVQRRVAAHAGPLAGILVSSLLFAGIHLNVSGFLIYLVIGTCLGWVADRTGGLTAPIIGHVLVNAAQVGVAFAGYV
jgi:membrane protease YdiL (CAAX protease family)